MVKKKFWTKEKVIEEGRKYDYRRDFENNAKSAYTYAVKHGLLDVLFNDKPNRGYKIEKRAYSHKEVRVLVHWTKERVIEESKKYMFRRDFLKGCTAAYNAAYEKGWLDELFEDRPNKGYKKKVLALKDDPLDKGKYWTKERLIKEGRKHKYRNDFRIANQSAYQAARKEGLLDEIFKKAPNMGFRNKTYMKAKLEANSPNRCKYWTEERILKELVKYPSLKKFCRANTGANATIERNKLRPKIHAYLVSLYEDMSRDYIESIAKLYMTRSEFRVKSSMAYRAAKYQGILDEVCAHMHTQHQRKKENKK